MKKILYPFCLLAALSFVSCDKVKTALFPDFDLALAEAEIEIPIIVSTSAESEMGEETVSMNLDSAIRANTNDEFNLSHVNSIKVKRVEIELLNADEENNLSNFEYAKVYVATGANNPVIVGSYSIADAYATSVSFQAESADLKSLLSANQFTYSVAGKARRVTNKILDAKLKIILRVE
jgi:hypothetical protein